MTSPTAYPLQRPPGSVVTRNRESGKFRTPLPVALKNVRTSLNMFAKDSGKAISNLVISSNCSLGVAKPADPGIAAWFTWHGIGVCICVDRYDTPESNLQAIHHIIEARRTELRHGTLALVRATFEGFKALPAPGPRSWPDVLGIEEGATVAEIEAAFRQLAKERHPDAGGSDALMAELNGARSSALSARAST